MRGLDFPKTEDGAKVVILTADKAEVWFKDKMATSSLPKKALSHRSRRCRSSSIRSWPSSSFRHESER